MIFSEDGKCEEAFELKFADLESDVFEIECRVSKGGEARDAGLL